MQVATQGVNHDVTCASPEMLVNWGPRKPRKEATAATIFSSSVHTYSGHQSLVEDDDAAFCTVQRCNMPNAQHSMVSFS